MDAEARPQAFVTASALGAKRRWLISALGALATVTLLGAMFFAPRVPVPVVMAAPPPAPITVHPGRADDLVLLDLKPLFLPTPFNAAPKALAEEEPGQALLNRGREHLTLAAENPRIDLPAAVRAPASPVEAAAIPPMPLALGFGEADTPLKPVPSHGGYVDVFVPATGERVLTLALPPDARPTLAGQARLEWKPMELAAAVDPAGLVGPPMVTTSSGDQSVDEHFRNYLARTLRLGDRLPPGFYRIVVGP